MTADGHVMVEAAHAACVDSGRRGHEGQQIRLAGQGKPGTGGGPPGDLFLEVTIRQHPLFKLEGRDVTLTLPVAPWEAALGEYGGRADTRRLGGHEAASRGACRPEAAPARPRPAGQLAR